MTSIKKDFNLDSLNFLLESNKPSSSTLPGRISNPRPQIRPRGPMRTHNEVKDIESLLPPVTHESIDMRDVYKEVFSKLNDRQGNKRGGRR